MNIPVFVLNPSLILIVIASSSLGSTSPLIVASNQRGSSNLVGSIDEKISFGHGCDGRTDYPHESSHVLFTVNVEALTECPSQEVSITTTISRPAWWFFSESKSITSRGFERVKVNVSLPCKWKNGQRPITYVVTSHHSNSRGEQAITKTTARLKC